MSTTVFVLLVLLVATLTPSAIAVAVVIVLHELDRRRGDPRPGYLIDPASETRRNGHGDRDRIPHD